MTISLKKENCQPAIPLTIPIVPTIHYQKEDVFLTHQPGFINLYEINPYLTLLDSRTYVYSGSTKPKE